MQQLLQHSQHSPVLVGHWSVVELDVVVDYLQIAVVCCRDGVPDCYDFVDVHVHDVLSPAPSLLSGRT